MDSYEATDRALGTIEILAMILEQLPGRKIFTVQRVSKLWMAVIDTSPTIQCKLFLRARREPVAPITCNTDEGWLEYERELEVNQLVNSLTQAIDWDAPPEKSEVEISTNHRGRGSQPRKERASCDRMFVTQPPCTIVEGYSVMDLVDNVECRFSVRNQAGLRFRDLVLASEGAMAHFPDDFPDKEDRSLVYTLWMPVGEDVRAEWTEQYRLWQERWATERETSSAASAASSPSSSFSASVTECLECVILGPGAETGSVFGEACRQGRLPLSILSANVVGQCAVVWDGSEAKDACGTPRGYY